MLLFSRGSIGGLKVALPIGPKVVPFGITLWNSKYEPQKGTTLGPLGRAVAIQSSGPRGPNHCVLGCDVLEPEGASFGSGNPCG